MRRHNVRLNRRWAGIMRGASAGEATARWGWWASSSSSPFPPPSYSSAAAAPSSFTPVALDLIQLLSPLENSHLTFAGTPSWRIHVLKGLWSLSRRRPGWLLLLSFVQEAFNQRSAECRLFGVSPGVNSTLGCSLWDMQCNLVDLSQLQTVAWFWLYSGFSAHMHFRNLNFHNFLHIFFSQNRQVMQAILRHNNSIKEILKEIFIQIQTKTQVKSW